MDRVPIFIHPLASLNGLDGRKRACLEDDFLENILEHIRDPISQTTSHKLLFKVDLPEEKKFRNREDDWAGE